MDSIFLTQINIKTNHLIYQYSIERMLLFLLVGPIEFSI